jgi:hypothetical protein
LKFSPHVCPSVLDSGAFNIWWRMVISEFPLV